jgi:hypothetical protein
MDKQQTEINDGGRKQGDGRKLNGKFVKVIIFHLNKLLLQEDV